MPAGRGADTVVVMVPGATYSGVYWDFPYQPQTYSQVRSLLSAGHATYVVDRLGTGTSSVPPSALVTASVQADGVHRSIQRLRAAGFDTVVLMGHSLGTLISIIESSRYHDVDGVILTGLTHRLNLAVVSGAFARLWPAPLDPAFASTLDVGYLTTMPGARGPLFHSASDPVPEVVAEDERTKSLVSAGEVADGLIVGGVLPTTLQIDVPVLMAVGSEDHLMCGPLGTDCTSAQTLYADETPYFGPAAQLRTYVLPGGGHDLTLARNTADYQRAVLDWLDSILG